MRLIYAATVALALAVVLPVCAQTATELKKELLPKIKKAQADGKDLGEAATEDEAVEHFEKAKSLMPAS